MGVERWTKEQKPLRILKVEMLPLDSLHPHEEVIDVELEEFCTSLETKGVFFRPILVDRASRVVLDGHHRVEGLRRLGAVKVPAILVDYRDDELELHTWYPLVWESPTTVSSLLSAQARHALLPQDEALGLVDSSEAGLALLPATEEGVAVFYGEARDLLSVLGTHYDVEYTDTLEYVKKLKRQKGTLIYRRTPTKDEVISRALAGDRYPPKTTRHHLPFRYQDIRIKLSYLF